MPPKPVKRDSSASLGRYSPLPIPAFKPRPSPPTPVVVPAVTITPDEEIRTYASKAFNRSLPPFERCQAFYSIFTDIASELADCAQYNAVMTRIADDLHSWCDKPCALMHAQPCTLSHAQPCTLSHDPVTVTVTKEVHPASCSTEIRNLQKEISNLKSGIDSLYHSANSTHTVASFASTPLASSSPSLSELDSFSESSTATKDSYYGSSTASTPRLGSKPLLTTPRPMSYANAAKTAVTKSPKEIHRQNSKIVHKQGDPSKHPQMRQKVDDILVDNKCKMISWSARGNLVTKCAKPLSDGDKTSITNLAKATFKNNPTVLNKPTFSYVKFIDVPLLDIEGTSFDTNDLNAMIQQNEKWANIAITHGPTIIVKKDSTNAKKATIKVGFEDDKSSNTAKRLLKTTVLFGGTPIRCKPWTSAPPVCKQRAPDASITDTEVSLAT
ncbi:hypothetical protein JOM56_011583 [Amanita muscaria]